MQCVFSFLTLTELVRVTRCCAQWDKWAAMPMGRTDVVKIMAHFPNLMRSRLLRHVGEIVQMNESCKIDDVNRLRAATSNLVRMDIAMNVFASPLDVPLRLPSSLADMTLTFNGQFPEVTTHLLEGVCNTVSIKKLSLHVLFSTWVPMPSFTHLSRLTQLESLKISGEPRLEATHLNVIKQMKSLRSLSLFNESWTADNFQTLCTPPHALHNLEEIGMQRTWMGAIHITSLQHIPTLTRFAPRSMTVSALHLLRHHLPPACVHLSVHVSTPAEIDELFAIDLSRIQTLHVSDCISFSNDDGFRFLSTRLTSVTDLSVHFRSPYPIDPTGLCMPRLRRLAIDTYENIYAHLLPEHFTGMPALTSLDLSSVFA